MTNSKILMTFTTPPSFDDLETIARGILDNLPDEYIAHRDPDEIDITVEDLADEAMEEELDLDDPYDLQVLYKGGNEIKPGVVSKGKSDEDSLILFRRPILEEWCDQAEDLTTLIRQLVLEEIGRFFEFSDEAIEEIIENSMQNAF